MPKVRWCWGPGLAILSLALAYLLLSEGKHLRPLQRQHPHSWTYSPDRDNTNTALSSVQCNKAFPRLFYEIDRAATFWSDRNHTITEKDIDISQQEESAFKVLVCDNQLTVTEHVNKWIEHDAFCKRCFFVLSQINRALQGATVANERLPCVEFAIAMGDWITISGETAQSLFAFARRLDQPRHEGLWLIPDFPFFASPPSAGPWHQMQTRAMAHDIPIHQKIPKVVWRGQTWTNKELRGHLLDVTKSKSWADVEAIDWSGSDNIIEMDDICRYMFLAHTEGRSYSERLIQLLNCKSVPIIHELQWTTHSYHLLTPTGPQQNFVLVRRDFSDLEEQVMTYLQRQDLLERIAENVVSTFRDRYTSPAAESCYWRRLIQRYSEVAFTPNPFTEATVTIGGTQFVKKKVRGTPLEELVW